MYIPMYFSSRLAQPPNSDCIAGFLLTEHKTVMMKEPNSSNWLQDWQVLPASNRLADYIFLSITGQKKSILFYASAGFSPSNYSHCYFTLLISIGLIEHQWSWRRKFKFWISSRNLLWVFNRDIYPSTISKIKHELFGAPLAQTFFLAQHPSSHCLYSFFSAWRRHSVLLKVTELESSRKWTRTNTWTHPPDQHCTAVLGHNHTVSFADGMRTVPCSRLTPFLLTLKKIKCRDN